MDSACRLRYNGGQLETSKPLRSTNFFQDGLMRILVCDGLEKAGVAILSATQGVTVDERPAIDKFELAEIIGEYDGLIVRSKTKVTAELIERAARLRVIGRAGTGVDNIDVPAATRRGIIVMNAAAGNTVTTAEHTWAMLMAL